MCKKLLEITLTNDEAEVIRRNLSDIKYNSIGNNNYVNHLRVSAYKSFPVHLLDLLEKLKFSSDPKPYMIFNNLPLDDNIVGSPTFDETGSSYKDGCLSENIICAFGAIMGEPYSIYFEGRELVNNLTPQKNAKKDYTGLGSEVELDLHIENAALRYTGESDCSPVGMFLLGLRKDKNNIGPKTFVSDARVAITMLSEEDIETLYQKNYIIRLPHRWRKAFSGQENTDLSPMITGPRNFPRMSAAFYPDMVLPVNQKAKNAFDNLYNALKSISVGIDISPGKLVYIDNRFALHSREKFIPTYDQNGYAYRWVQRLFITSNLWNFRTFPSVGDRVFNPGIC